MAKIVLSDVAPKDDTLSFSLGQESGIEVPYETDDRELLANANAHPWLEVEYDETQEAGGVFIDNQLSPADDHLSAVNDHSNDPDAVRAEIERRLAEVEDPTPLAVRSGLDQNEPVSVGPVALTLAADEDDNEQES